MQSIQIEPHGETWLKNAIDENFQPTGTVRAAFYVAREKGIKYFKENIIEPLSQNTKLHLLLDKISDKAMELVKKFPPKVKVKFLRDNIHAKTLILENETTGRLCIGSANLTESAMTSEAKEMNVNIMDIAKGDVQYDKAAAWFDKLWNKANDPPCIINDTDDSLKEIYTRHKLFGYQKDAVENLHKFYDEFSNKKIPHNTLLTMPTGSGKTVVAACWLAELLEKNEKLKICWIAPQHELLLQAKETLTDFNIPENKISYCNPSDRNGQVILSTVQSISKYSEKIDILIYDEAHHINPEGKIAKGGAWTINLLKAMNYKIFIGMSATPFRMKPDDDKRFKEFFPEKNGYAVHPVDKKFSRGHVYYIDTSEHYKKQLKDNNGENVLAKRIYIAIDTKIPIELERKNKESAEMQIARISRSKKSPFNTPTRNKIIVDQVLNWYNSDSNSNNNSPKRILLFACNNTHANDLGEFLINTINKRTTNKPTVQVFHTGYVSPESSDEISSCNLEDKPFSSGMNDINTINNRKRVLEKVRNGEINILIAVGLATEGIDIPALDCVAIARPAISTKFYFQMVGRGLRGPAVGGNPTVTVLNFVDDIYYKEKHEKRLNEFMFDEKCDRDAGNSFMDNPEEEENLAQKKNKGKPVTVYCNGKSAYYYPAYDEGRNSKCIEYKNVRYTCTGAAKKACNLKKGDTINGPAVWKDNVGRDIKKISERKIGNEYPVSSPLKTKKNSNLRKTKTYNKINKRESPKLNPKGKRIKIYMEYKKQKYHALFSMKEQQILYKGKWYAPSGAARHIKKGKQSSGWDDWKIESNGKELQTIRKK